jgi:hypothetical protein
MLVTKTTTTTTTTNNNNNINNIPAYVRYVLGSKVKWSGFGLVCKCVT